MSEPQALIPQAAPAETPPQRWPWANVFFVSVMIVLPFILFLTVIYRARKQEPELPKLGAIPAFEGTERSGEKLTSAELEGKVWVAGFIFTRCMGPCPLLSQRMAKLQLQFGRNPGFRLVSFTLDPEHDTPEVLKTYANNFGAEPGSWYFVQLRSWEDVQNLSQTSFHLTALEDPTAMRAHDPRLVLIDAQGQMRGAYLVLDDDSWHKLQQDLAELLRGQKL